MVGVDVEEAKRLYREATRGGVAGAARAYAQLLIDLDDFSEAEDVLRKSVDAGELSNRGLLANVLVYMYREVEAMQILSTAFREGEIGAALQAATIFAEILDDREQAEMWYRLAVRSGDPDAKNDYGDFLRGDEARLDEAERLLREAMAGGDPLAPGNLGRLEIDRGNYGVAVDLLLQSLASGCETVLLPLAEAETRLGNDDKAREYFKQARDRRVPNARLAYARFLADRLKGGAADEAEREFLIAVEEDGSREAEASFYYGLFLEGEDRGDAAVRAYLRAARKNNEAAQHNLALIYLDRGDLEKAEKYFRKAVEAGCGEALSSYLDMLNGQGRFKEAASLQRGSDSPHAAR
ncbi:tetratricopeptide repeat protein [Actinomadura violacea]|uniref:Tetratricopeptide repeat protein n=1 Tax=Actinomadura violacea TaxID=2819934 RepID=A0ABS3RNB2_9ACTN|nr:tetratricopeptide repeat protein [Actinomadura violacea]MBO2458217.1 tetratricopeptide repeat protein [Actinomadura violacea]